MTLGAFVWSFITLGIAAVFLVGLFQGYLNDQADRDLGNQLIQLVAVTDARNGNVTVTQPLAEPQFQRPLSGWSWQIRRGELILAQSASLGPIDSAAALSAPLGTAGVFEGPFGNALRGLARNVQPRFGIERLTFVVARPQSELTLAVADFRTTLLWSLAVLALGQVVTVVVLMRSGLRPLTELRQRVAALRDGTSPIPATWPRELAPILKELQTSTDHIERLLTRARATASDLAHGIKTPLSVMTQIAETLPQETSQPLQSQMDRIHAVMSRHLARMRSGSPGFGRVSIETCVDDLRVALGPVLQQRKITLTTDIVEGAMFRGDENDLYEMLGNPLENATKWAGSKVRLSASVRGDGRIRIEVADDGPGIPEPKRGAIFERGRRLDQTVPGHGIGLAILLDLADLYGGSVDLAQAPEGGLLVTVNLPNG